MIIAFCQDMKTKKIKVEKKKIRIETNEDQGKDDKKEQIISEKNQDQEIGDESMSERSESISDDNSLNSDARECERISRALTFKIINYRKALHSTDKTEKENEMESSNEFNDDLKKEIEITDIEKDTSHVIKEDHFYRKENSIDKETPKPNFGFKKKRSQFAITLAAGLNSIKYRLKKNYFGQINR